METAPNHEPYPAPTEELEIANEKELQSQVGSILTVDQDGQQMLFQLVQETELENYTSDDIFAISIESPAGDALLNRSVGETVEYLVPHSGKTMAMTIINITT